MASCRAHAASSAATIPRYNMASCRSRELSPAERIPRYTRTVQYGQRLNKVLNVFMESFKELSRVSKARKIEQKYRESSYYLPKLTSNSYQLSYQVNLASDLKSDDDFFLKQQRRPLHFLLSLSFFYAWTSDEPG